MSISPFDFMKNILSKEKRYSHEEVVNEFNLFMVNRIFSNDQQLILIANELNKKGITNQMGYDCYFYGIPKSKRFIQYNSKKEKTDKHIQYLMEYYQCNLTTAKQYMNLISDEEKLYIVDFFEKRGTKK